jgi:hypothetical protein
MIICSIGRTLFRWRGRSRRFTGNNFGSPPGRPAKGYRPTPGGRGRRKLYPGLRSGVRESQILMRHG